MLLNVLLCYVTVQMLPLILLQIVTCMAISPTFSLNRDLYCSFPVVIE